MSELIKTEAGAARGACMTDRMKRFLADRVKEGDQRDSREGIVGDMPQVGPSSEFVPFVRTPIN